MDIVGLIKDKVLEKPQMDGKTIRIECDGSTTVNIDELRELQHYKDLTDKAYGIAKTSILELGFSFPVFLWIDKDGAKWIIDAHQRKRTLIRMRDTEGYSVPLLPACRIFAKDRKEAKKKILAQESQYGKIQEEEFHEFMNEPNFELDSSEVEEFVMIPEFEREYHPLIEDDATKNKELDPDKKGLDLECPNCHHKGDKDEFIPK